MRVEKVGDGLAGRTDAGEADMPPRTPDPGRFADAAVTHFAAEVTAQTGREFADYTPLQAWSIDYLDELADGGYWLALLVVPIYGVELTDEVIDRLTTAISTQASPRHVPDYVLAGAATPHTRTGKRLEVPVKRLIQGHLIDQVASPGAVDDHAALTQFQAYAGGPVWGNS